MEELKRKYKSERQRKQTRQKFGQAKSGNTDLIKRLTEKYAEELEEPKVAKTSSTDRFKSQMKINTKMVLHNINEEDSSMEDDSENDANKTQEITRDLLHFGHQDDKNLDTSHDQINQDGLSQPLMKKSRHVKMHSLDLTRLDTKNLKKLIHNQSRHEEKYLKPQQIDEPIDEVVKESAIPCNSETFFEYCFLIIAYSKPSASEANVQPKEENFRDEAHRTD